MSACPSLVTRLGCPWGAGTLMVALGGLNPSQELCSQGASLGAPLARAVQTKSPCHRARPPCFPPFGSGPGPDEPSLR